jgi:ABC-type multidrug transport system, ATPase and permease components
MAIHPFEDQKYNGNKSWGPFVKRVSTYSMRYPKWVASVMTVTILSTLAEVLFPIILLKLIDHELTPLVSRYISTGRPVPTHLLGNLYIYGWLFIGVALLEVIGVSGFFYFSGKIKEQVIFDMRSDLFIRMHELSFDFYDRNSTGWLVTRITTDIDRVADLISWGFMIVVKGVVLMLLYLVFMFIYNIPLSLITLVSIPLLLLTSVYYRKKILAFSRDARRTNSEMVSYFTENINGIEINKSTVQEERAGQRMEEYSALFKKHSFMASFNSALFGPTIILVSTVAVAVLIVAGSYMNIVQASISVGALAAFFGYSRNLFLPVFDISRVYAMAQSSLSAGERIFSLLDTRPTIQDNSDNLAQFEEIKGSIQFKNVTFQYSPEKPVLKNLSFKIRVGQSVALVGATGCGKSTIASLISRFYEPVQGVVEIDGIDYRHRSLKSLRQQIGIVQQTPQIFSGTILENIRYGNFYVSEREIKAALTLIQANDLLNRLHHGVVEDGANLSIGEKQIISIVRVILLDPSIVILDEATSALDLLTEAQIQRGIRYLTSNRTSVIIAHRLSTIQNCDRIFVIKEGEVIEDDSHHNLLKYPNGAYRKLYEEQYAATEDYGINI